MSRPLRVCFVVNVPPERYSGAALHARWLARHLARWNVCVEFLAFSKERRPPGRLPDGFPVHFVREGTGRFGEVVLWSEMWKFFRHHRRFDVIHAHSCGYRESFLPVVARASGMASLANVMLQGSDLAHSGRLEAPVRNRLIRLYDGVVPISEETLHEAIAAGVSTQRLVRIPIGVDAERFRPVSAEARQALRHAYGLPADRPVIAFVGALTARKNVLWLLDRWRTRPAPLREAHLFLVGDVIADDPEAVELRRQVERRVNAANSRSRWVPFVEEIERVYQASDVLVLPSLAEGMPSVVLQAMACGIPVVATPTSGVPELLGRRGERGFLFDFDDARGFWSALETVLEEPSREHALAESARAYVLAHCSLDIVARRYRDLYLGLVESRRASRVRS